MFTSDVFAKLGIREDVFASRGLDRFEEAQDLVPVQQDANGRIHELEPEAADAWWKLSEAAQRDGQKLILISAFRSVTRQAEIVLGKYQSGQSLDEIFAVSAPPGFSEHHTGRAIDLATPGYGVLEEDFEDSEAFRWLVENAAKYGFFMTYPRGNAQGYLYEPWHWCFHKLAGIENPLYE